VKSAGQLSIDGDGVPQEIEPADTQRGDLAASQSERAR
jgi:hypothetical protein